MPSINETIYPQIKNNISLLELNEIYTPTSDDIKFVNKSARGDTQKSYLLIMLKMFQRLGYFIQMKDVPENILKHILNNSFFQPLDIDYEKYDSSNTKNNHVAAIRNYLNIKPNDKRANHIAIKEAIEASKIKDNDADIINVVIDKLLQQRYELPAFSTLVRLSRKARHTIYSSYYKHVFESISDETKKSIDKLFYVNQNDVNTGWNDLKELSGKPTVNTLVQIIEILNSIKAFNVKEKILLSIPDSKLRHFVYEAEMLDASRMKELNKFKRYTLAVAFISQRCANILDDIGEIFVKLVRSRQNKARDKQIKYKLSQSKTACDLITTLKDIMVAYKTQGNHDERFIAIVDVLKSHGTEIADEIINKCEIHNTFAGDNYFPFAWDCIKGKCRITLLGF